MVWMFRLVCRPIARRLDRELDAKAMWLVENETELLRLYDNVRSLVDYGSVAMPSNEEHIVALADCLMLRRGLKEDIDRLLGWSNWIVGEGPTAEELLATARCLHRIAAEEDDATRRIVGLTKPWLLSE